MPVHGAVSTCCGAWASLFPKLHTGMRGEICCFKSVVSKGTFQSVFMLSIPFIVYLNVHIFSSLDIVLQLHMDIECSTNCVAFSCKYVKIGFTAALTAIQLYNLVHYRFYRCTYYRKIYLFPKYLIFSLLSGTFTYIKNIWIYQMFGAGKS